MPISKTERRDCMEAMRELPDKFFDLAVVDPPYGIGITGKSSGGEAATHTHTHTTPRQSRKLQTVRK